MNAGTLTNLNVGGGYTALVQFDLSLLPAGTTAAGVTRAVLRVYCNRADTPGVMAVQPVLAGWGEYTVTYQTLPALGAAAQLAQVDAADEFVALDVTATVKAWIAGTQPNNGLAFSAGSALLQFDSKENDQTSHPPQLEIVLATGGNGTQGPAGPTGPQGIAGLQGPPGSQGLQGFAGLPGATGPQGATGAQGPAGSTGPAGLAGSTGPAGPAGSVGPAGPVGAVGPAGTPGLVYQGAYASTVNYATGDVVVFGGASYTSLVASNRGQTPGQSPAFWGVLTAQGPQGVQGVAGLIGAQGLAGPPGPVGPPGDKGDQGLQGTAGQAGAQGLQGPMGPQGAAGPVGPQGAAGPVGMAFRGAYDSTINYALADGVTYGGTGYISRIAGNQGQTPDQSPSAWSVFATGTTGPPGASGATGVQGAQGSQGLPGPAGPQGLAGATGPQGPAVANYTGNYSPVNSYAVADAVSYGGSTYISLLTNNHGQTPDQSPTYWAVLAAQGAAGPAGPSGAQGLAGPAGANGAPGPTGAPGPPVAFAGVWQPGFAYSVGDAVSFGGASYIATSPNVGQRPDVSAAMWGVLSARGAQGPVGAQGLPGLTGAQGDKGDVGAQGPAGQAGAQGIQGVAGTVGAQGPIGPAGVAGVQGPAGATGAAGSVGMNFRGSWTQGAGYSFNDAVTFAGSTYLSLDQNRNQQPDVSPQDWAVVAQAGLTGPSGPSGAPGSAATVSVGLVSTLAAGAQATVTNTGTGAAAVLNFGIPQGAAGSSSGGGVGGVGGASFAAVFHSVSFSTSFYAVNAATASASESQAVLAWIPRGCSAVRLDVASQQSNTVTVTLRAGTPGAMADTALSCAASSGGSCTATGAVSVAAGSFIDFAIAGPSGTPAGVWTQLECD